MKKFSIFPSLHEVVIKLTYLFVLQNMESQETKGSFSFTNAERPDKSMANNEMVQDENGKVTNDFDKVSPSTTYCGKGDPRLTMKCVFCNQAPLCFGELKLLQCLHSACTNCFQTLLTINKSTWFKIELIIRNDQCSS